MEVFACCVNRLACSASAAVGLAELEYQIIPAKSTATSGCCLAIELNPVESAI